VPHASVDFAHVLFLLFHRSHTAFSNPIPLHLSSLPIRTGFFSPDNDEFPRPAAQNQLFFALGQGWVSSPPSSCSAPSMSSFWRVLLVKPNCLQVLLPPKIRVLPFDYVLFFQVIRKERTPVCLTGFFYGHGPFFLLSLRSWIFWAEGRSSKDSTGLNLTLSPANA